MRRLLLLILFVCAAGPAVAGPYEDGRAADRRGDFAAAVSSYRTAANQGHAKAQCGLGLMYEHGLGVGRDYVQAAKWFRKGAEQGDAECQNYLAGSYEQGHGVPKDDVIAVSWYRKAADQGDIYAQIRLGDSYRIGLGVAQDGATAISWYRRAADQGSIHAQNLLGILYEQGKIVPRDEAEAMKWYRKAADRGDAPAKQRLQDLLDKATNLDVWLPRAERGNAEAQYKVGVMYDTGRGAPQDFAVAASWYRKAAEQGDAIAQVKLAFMYVRGRGVPQDYAAAVPWYRKAANQGNVTAQSVLGYIYEMGEGVPQDYVQAHIWFNLAISRYGDEKDNEARGRALESRARLAAKMTPAQIAEAQKLASEWKPTLPIASPGMPAASASPPPRGTSGSWIPMKKDGGGTYVVPVLINNVITLGFTVDSGASDVTISEDVVATLMRMGEVRDGDFLGEQTYTLADGSKVRSRTFRIRSLKVGDRVLENVTCNVASTKAILLLGQSFLGRFKSWSIDNTKHVLVLE